MTPENARECGRWGACSFLPTSLEAVVKNSVFVRAELGIESAAGPLAGFKPVAAMFALSNLGAGGQFLSELQPESIEQTVRTKFPLQSLGQRVAYNLRIQPNARTCVIPINYKR